MKIKKILLLFLLVTCTTITSCGNNSNQDYLEEYTVIWQDYNGDILELDRNVKEGSLPSYDGSNPTREKTNKYNYTFVGWEPEISAVYENVTYTAIYTSNINNYTVTWKNENGEVLETDLNVPYGSIPTYDGPTPSKEDTEEYKYIFKGWNQKIDKVKEDVTYVASYIEKKKNELIPGEDPIISEDGKTIEYGFYPQMHVKDEALIAELNKLTKTEVNGWYLYNEEYYYKEEAKVYNSESYTFDDGINIVSGTQYWYKCETIKWQILYDDAGSYFLLSSLLLDAKAYYSNYDIRTIDNTTVYANNYEYSNIRSWLNNEFYNSAFAFNNSYISTTMVENVSTTTDSSNSEFECNDTNDKVYLPSYVDYFNTDYGFEWERYNTSKTRECKTTDYARARGAWCNKDTSGLKNNGSYWTRSPSSEFSYCAWNVNSAGYLSSYAVDGESHCVRPCINITLA